MSTSPSVLAVRRQFLERWIDEAIALLDTLDGDPDLEVEEAEHDDAEFDRSGKIMGGQGG